MLRQLAFLATLLFVSAHGLELFSNGFQNGARIPRIHTCDTANFGVSPELHWRNVPPQTKALALAVFDETNYGTFLNWLITNIPKDATSLPAGSNKHLPAGAREESAWIGMCPPSGELHTYNFELYALGQELSSLPEDAAAAVSFLRRQALSHARLSGVYGEELKTNTKRAVTAVVAANALLANDTIPTTNLLGGGTIEFVSTQRTTNTPPNGRVVRVVVVATFTFSAGGACFNSGFGQPTFNPATQFCGNAAGGSLTLLVEQVVTTPTFQFWFVAAGAVGTNTTFSGVINVQQYFEPADQRALTPGTRTPFTLSLNGLIVFILPPWTNLPDIPVGKLLEIISSFDIEIGAGAAGDTFQICVVGGFTPVNENDGTPVCRPIGSGLFSFKVSRRFQRGVFPSRIYIVIKPRASKRAVMDVSGFVTAATPSLAAVAATGSTGGTCDQWTVINFNFADLVNK